MKLLLTTLLVALIASAPAEAAPTLIHWWKGDGNANDSVGTNNGSLVGDATFTAGVSGQAFSLDGNGDYVSVPDDPSHYFSGSFTVDGWEKTTANTGQRQLVAIYECGAFCPTNMANSALVLELIDGQAFGFVRDSAGLGPDAGGEQAVGGPSIADGVFHRVTFIRDLDAGKLGLYVDGIEVVERGLDPGAAGALENLDGEADPLTIGAQIEGGTGTPVHFFDGAIDDVRMSTGADYPDHTPPQITPAISGPQGNDGWYRGDVQAGWTITDESVIRSSSGCDTVAITADTAGTALACQATSAGGTGNGSVTIKRDATPPTLKCSVPSPAFVLGAQGKSVSATVADALSGPAAATVSAPPDTSSPGSKSVKITGADVAGNTAGVTCPYTVQAPVTTITSLHQCLRIGPFRYRFKVPLKKLQGGREVNRRSRVRIVKFKLDSKPDGSDKKRPFVANIETSKLSEGKHVLTADVLLQVPGTSKHFHHRQKFPFSTCA